MRNFIPVMSACAALLLAACGRQSSMDDQMKQDLQAASAGGIELAPRASGTKVVSAIEQNKPVQPKVTPVRRVQAPAQTPRRQVPQETKAAETNAVETTAAEPTATVPTSTPRVQPAPPGGYKTVNEVIRNAPFPIKPAFWRP